MDCCSRKISPQGWLTIFGIISSDRIRGWTLAARRSRFLELPLFGMEMFGCSQGAHSENTLTLPWLIGSSPQLLRRACQISAFRFTVMLLCEVPSCGESLFVTFSNALFSGTFQGTLVRGYCWVAARYDYSSWHCADGRLGNFANSALANTWTHN